MNERYLPVGTVVTLKEATKKVMIIGYFPMSEDKKVFDYNACIYPEGVIDATKTLAFNHSQIGSIDYMGLVNEESQSFNNELKNMLENLESLKDMQLPEASAGEENVMASAGESVQQSIGQPMQSQPIQQPQVNDIAGIMNEGAASTPAQNNPQNAAINNMQN